MSPRFPLLLAALLLCGPARAPAQQLSRDDVLARHYEAIGGLERWQTVQSMRATGRMTLGQGVEAPFVVFGKRPSRARLEFTFQGMTGIQAYDGETAWMIMPFFGKTEPEPMPAEEAKQWAEQADVDGVLVGWAEAGHQIELLGLEDVEGTEAYKLRVTLANGLVRYYYLDSEFFLTIKSEGTQVIQGAEMDMETILGDYKPVGGLLMPHSVETRPKGAAAGQVITIDTIELNVPVPDSLFVMPPPREGAR